MSISSSSTFISDPGLKAECRPSPSATKSLMSVSLLSKVRPISMSAIIRTCALRLCADADVPICAPSTDTELLLVPTIDTILKISLSIPTYIPGVKANVGSSVK